MTRLTKTGGKTSKAKTRKVSPTKSYKSVKTKRRVAVAARHHRRRSLPELIKELNEAREQQTATAEILKVINTSKGDLAQVFDTILEKAHDLCDVTSGSLQLLDGEYTRAVAVRGMTEPFEQYLRRGYRVTKSVRQHVDPDRVIQHIDLLEVLAQVPDEAALRAAVDLGGIRSFLTVPLVKDGTVLGRIVAARKKVQPFTDKQIALLKSFAAQAVIAIENARLFNETKQALARQTATSEILRVISRSPTDVRPVFDAIVLTAVRLFRCDLSFVMLCDHTNFWVAAAAKPAGLFDELTLVKEKIDPNANFPSRTIVEKQALYLPDWSIIDLPEHERHIHETVGVNSALYLPLLREGECIGLLTLGGKQANIFGESEIALAESFRDQALIAIENARLFNETQEALERQTATADILKVIANSPTNVQPVFEAIAERSKRLVDALSTTVFRLEDGVMHLRAFTPTSPEADATLKAMFPAPLSNFSWSEAIGNGEIYRVVDTELEIEGLRELARLRGFRSMLFVPLLCDRKPIGVIAVTRVEPGPFVEHHVQLLQTFADQAVIAIENVRLFDEVQAKTHDLQEALEQQIATSEVLSVISSSAGDLAPVFDAMLGNAMKLCGANFGVLNTFDGTQFHTAATHGLPPTYDQFRRGQPLDYGPATAPARLLKGEPFVEIVDLVDTDTYRSGEPNRRALVDLGGARSLLAVPLLKDERVVGNVMIFRQEQRPFSEKQIMLLQQFGAQAVIAIENTRLITELHQRTDDLSEALTYQTGSANILKVIAASPTDVGPVLQAIVENACEVCDAYDAVVLLKNGDDLRFSAHHGPIAINLEKWPISRNWTAGRAFLDRKPVHVHDMLSDEGAEFPDSRKLSGYTNTPGIRSILSVPLLRDNESVGSILLRRTEVHPFSDKQINLLQTFADQAVIAIGNVRLFEEVQARTKELAASLDELRTAQDRLVQTEKLASLGQLTAGIAHEIKNPLNFVNNFSALSAELVDELNDTLKPAALESKMRLEVDDLTEMLKDNLEKVVQHGKRADSIVKNMLLHSREGSGEHRPADINAIVDESLNLAYHGARAEKPGFSIALQRDLDPSVGMADVYPQEITRALLNLISNGFYATTKRKVEAGDGFEAILSATTKNLGGKVEIRIRDNGTGIPKEVKEKIFNPFFTTKPSGEGTGLGLSMCHDIIVKQHGGSIDVETEPGLFTEFKIVLPRTN